MSDKGRRGVHTGAGRVSRGGGGYMSKVGPIWHFSVLRLLALGDTIPKP